VFPHLFEICNHKEWTVEKVLRNGNINLIFRRAFGKAEELEWEDLVEIVERVNLSQQTDSVSWIFEKSGEFSTTTLYKELSFPGVVNVWVMNIWRPSLSFKIKIFLCQICNDKVQFVDQLKKTNWVGPIECKLCGQMETTEHIYIQCVVTSFCWNVIRDVLE
jgi:hypothetical protein